MHKTKMTIFMALVWCCAMASNLAMAQASSTFTLLLSAVDQKVQDGSTAVVTVKMTNISDHTIEYASDGPGPLFRLAVLAEQNNAAKETAYGMKMHGTDPKRGGWFGSVVAVPLKSGGTLTRKIELGKEYDLSAPGVYRVSASRIDPETHMVVKSNEIQITVLPK